MLKLSIPFRRAAAAVPTLRGRVIIDHVPTRSFVKRVYSGSSDPPKYQNIAANLKDISKTAKQEAGKTFGSVMEAVGSVNETSQNDHLPGHTTTAKSAGSSSEVIADLRSLGGLVQAVPRGAIIFGAAGVVPYFATSISTVYLARQAFLSNNGMSGKFDAETALTLLYHNESLQVAYGAVILSFLGAIHWGIEFAVRGMNATQTGGPSGMQRYLLGTLPVVLAWPTLLLPGQLALASQWAAFTVVWYFDMLATGWGWTPRWYSTYRFGLTSIVGGSLLVTLAATNYWATDHPGFTSTSKKLQAIRDDESYHHHNTEEEGAGGRKLKGVMKKDAPVGSVSGEDAFVRITDVAAEKREAQAQEKRVKMQDANKSD